MVIALACMVVGTGSLVAAWVLPMVSDHLPSWFRITLLVGGLALILSGGWQF